MVRLPVGADAAITKGLADENIFVPGCFRISPAANEDIVEPAMPGFERALKIESVAS